jgi:hypothetical protein
MEYHARFDVSEFRMVENEVESHYNGTEYFTCS